MVKIGTIIGGFEVYGTCNEYCIAKSTSPDIADLYIVCRIDNGINLAHINNYFTDRMDAEWEFASLAFPWFQDNVHINMIEN